MKVQVELGTLMIHPPSIRRWKHGGKVLPRDIHWSEAQDQELSEDGELTLTLPPSAVPRFVRVQVPGGEKAVQLIEPGGEDA